MIFLGRILKHFDERSNQFVVEPAQESDMPTVAALLHRVNLSPDGLAEHLASMFVVRGGTGVAGSAALQRYGSVALLRSVAVDSLARGNGIGQSVLNAIAAFARVRHIQDIYLRCYQKLPQHIAARRRP